MGLDQWLYAKTTKRELNDHTGVCSGLFNMVPTAGDGMVQIGYWRKAYDQNYFINSVVKAPLDEAENLHISKDEVETILKGAKYILKNHVFDKESGEDITESNADSFFISESYTYQSKRKWKETIEFFTEAKKILEEDPDAEIYYHIWY